MRGELKYAASGWLALINLSTCSTSYQFLAGHSLCICFSRIFSPHFLLREPLTGLLQPPFFCFTFPESLNASCCAGSEKQLSLFRIHFILFHFSSLFGCPFTVFTRVWLPISSCKVTPLRHRSPKRELQFTSAADSRWLEVAVAAAIDTGLPKPVPFHPHCVTYTMSSTSAGNN